MGDETIWDILLEYYTESEARRWLTSPHPMLKGETPAVYLALGNTHAVENVIRMMDSQVAT